MRPPSPSIPEKEFFFAALGQGLRLDGRAPLTSRPVEIVFGTEMGYVEVALGKTRHACFLGRYTHANGRLMRE
jgi:exosome complex component RRP45